MKSAVVFLALLGVAFAIPSNVRDYVGSQVFTVIPSTQSQINYLAALEETGHYDFWKTSRIIGRPVDIMAKRWMLPSLKKIFEDQGLDYTIKISDLHKLIIETTENNEVRRAAARNEGKAMEWTAYHTYDEIMDWLEELAATYPELCTVSDVGTSYEGRTMKKLVVSTGGTGKPVIFMDAGIHAREWIAPATATFIMNELITNSAAYQSSLDVIDFVFMPSINPDGYSYSWTNERLWRKTRTPFEGSVCYGVDPNRNWDFQWGVSGSSSLVCSDTYLGPTPFSEACTSVVRDEVLAVQSNAVAYISLHSAAELWLRPWGYARNEYPDNDAEAEQLCLDAIGALAAVHGVKYECISAGDFYPASGASDDWAKGVPEVEFVYTPELRDQGFGFVLPAEQIIPSGEETFAAFQVIFEYIRDNRT